MSSESNQPEPWRRAALWLALCSPGLIPLLAPHLPFQDWPGHLGVLGALVHLDDPAARISEFYQWKGWAGPNRLFYAAGFVLSQIFPPAFAGQVLLALCLGALGPATAWLARASGADPRLALFALPLALGRHLYCGFALNAAALALLVTTLAAYFHLRRAPTRRSVAGLLAALVALVFLHSFFYLVAFGLLGLMVASDLLSSDRRGKRPPILGGAALALSAIGLVPQLFALEARSQGGPGVFEAVWSAAKTAERANLAGAFWEWLFASYRYRHLDDWAQGLWMALLFGAILLAAWLERRDLWTKERLYLLGMALVTAGMFVFLPTNIGPPLNWWGGNLRLPPIAMLLLIPVPGGALDRLGPWLQRGAGAVMVSIVALAAADLIRFDRVEMKGFDEVIEAIPPGKKLSTLHYTPHELQEYPGEPHGYTGDYYLLVKGGLVPQNFFEVVDMPFARKVGMPSPPWGIAGAFNWSRDSIGVEAFLVRISPDNPDAPFTGPLKDQVELKKAAGNWRYYAPR